MQDFSSHSFFLIAFYLNVSIEKTVYSWIKNEQMTGKGEGRRTSFTHAETLSSNNEMPAKFGVIVIIKEPTWTFDFKHR